MSEERNVSFDVVVDADCPAPWHVAQLQAQTAALNAQVAALQQANAAQQQASVAQQQVGAAQLAAHQAALAEQLAVIGRLEGRLAEYEHENDDPDDFDVGKLDLNETEKKTD